MSGDLTIVAISFCRRLTISFGVWLDPTCGDGLSLLALDAHLVEGGDIGQRFVPACRSPMLRDATG